MTGASGRVDVADIVRAINFDAPEDRATYVHRIGRTGRAVRFSQPAFRLFN